MNMQDPLYDSNEILNNNISLAELEQVILKSKNKKSTGIDCLPYEVFKNKPIQQILLKLFQLCFDTSKIPSIWRKTLISPIPKSRDNDPRVPSLYRGISLICCAAKLYSSLLNERLTYYLETEYRIVDEQNGFRKKRSCLDHIFTLDSIIRNRREENKVTFTAFIDFEKAFDSVNRNSLLSKLSDLQIDGKIYFAVKSIYEVTEASIKINNMKTDWFPCASGVKQGDGLSPTLFNIYINDLASQIKALGKGVKFNNEEISILMYADDVVLLAEREEDLICMLSTLEKWTKKWIININVIKSKIVHFRPNKTDITSFKFFINKEEITIVSNYKYLGVYFNEFINFSTNAEILSQSAGRALGSIVSKYKQSNFMGYSTYCKLYNNCVLPVLDYSAGVWGYKKYQQTDQVQHRAMRIFLGVHRFAPIASLYGDMNWLYPQYKRWIDMIRLWNRLISLPTSRLARRIFDYDYAHSSSVQNWCSQVKAILIDFNDIELFANKEPCNLKDLEAHLMEKQKLEISDLIMQKPKLRFYKHFKETMSQENYVSFNLTPNERSILAQLRMGILPLSIETGRFINQPLEQRLCKLCNEEKIEDEWHFIFECSCYNDKRIDFFSEITNIRPDFIYLDESSQMKFLFENVHRKFAKFINCCFKARKTKLFPA